MSCVRYRNAHRCFLTVLGFRCGSPFTSCHEHGLEHLYIRLYRSGGTSSTLLTDPSIAASDATLMAYDPYQHAASDPYRFGEGQSQRQQRRRPQRGNGAPAFDIDTDSGDFSSPEVYPYTPHREHAHYPYTISSASPAGPSTLTCPIPGIDAPAAAHQMAGSSTSEFYPTSNYSRARGAQQWIPAQNINIPDVSCLSDIFAVT